MDAVPGGILTLDLSSNCGWCYAALTANRPDCGVWQLPKWGTDGAKFAAFEDKLVPAMERLQPSHLIIEKSLPFQALIGHSTLDTVNQQLGLRAIAHKEAYRYSASCMEIGADDVRYALLGQTRFAKGTVKGIVLAHCRALGFDVPDHNAADACMVWLWFVGQMRGTRPVAGPLFQQRQISS